MNTRSMAAGLGTLLIALSFGAQAQSWTAEQSQVREGSTGVMTTSRDTPRVSRMNLSALHGEASTMLGGQPNVIPLPMNHSTDMGASSTRGMGMGAMASASHTVAGMPSLGTPD